MRLIIAITGASGAIYGIRLLQMLRDFKNVESHLVLSKSAGITIHAETSYTLDQVRALADHVYDNANIGAAIASGSFQTAGMIIAPCSIKTLSAVVNCFSSDLVSRAADVVLKERRQLILMVRETPFHVGHCKLLLDASRMGAIIYPPVPAFYSEPESIEDIIFHTNARLLDLFDLKSDHLKRWGGLSKNVQTQNIT